MKNPSSSTPQDSNRSIVMVEDEPQMTVWYNCAVMLLGLLETLSLMLDLFKACSVGTTKVEELTPDTTFLYGGTSTCFKKVGDPFANRLPQWSFCTGNSRGPGVIPIIWIPGRLCKMI